MKASATDSYASNATILTSKITPCPRCRPEPTAEEMLRAANLWPVKRMDEWVPRPELARAVLYCDELLAGERWCVFMRGTVGTGKTHLAQATGTAWLEARKGMVLFRVVADLLDELRSTQASDSVIGLVDVLEKYASVSLLILDDIGVDRPTEFAKEQLFKLIDRRYRNQLPTVVTSNVHLDDVAERIGERLVSRLSSGELSISASDMRRR